MAHPVKHISLLKSVLSNSAPYSLALSIIFLHPLGSVAVARGEVVEIKNLPVQKGVHSSIQTTSPKTPSPQKPPTPSKPSEPEVLVSEVVVSGVDGKLENEVYKAIINTQPGRTTTRSKLQEDINAIFDTGWFSNVRSVPEDTPLGVRVKFEVKPNSVLKVVQMQGSQILPPSVVHQIFSPQYGSILNLRQLQERIKQLHLWYRYKGYSQAYVNAQPQVAADGTVTLGVTEGIVEAIQVRFVNDEGKDKDDRGKPILGHIPSSIILQKFKFELGKVFYQPQAVKDLQQIKDLGFFNDVNITLKEGKNPSQLIVLVNVDENELASHAQKILKYRQELQIFKATKNQLREAEVLQKLANIYSNAGKKQQAITEYKEALRIYQSKQDKLKEAHLLNNIANVHYKLEEYKFAVAEYQKALQIYKSKQYLLEEAKVLYNLGNIHNKLKQYQQAIDVYSQAVSRFKTMNLPFWEALTLNNIAYNYYELNETDRSLKFYNQALLLWHQLKNNPSNVKFQSAVSDENSQEGDFEFGYGVSSIKGTFFNVSIHIGEGENFNKYRDGVSDIRFWEASTLLNLGIIYQSIGDYQQALYLFSEAQQLLQSLSMYQIIPWDRELETSGNSSLEIFFKAVPLVFNSALYSDLGIIEQAENYAQDYANQISQIRLKVGAALETFWKEGMVKLAKMASNLGEKQQEEFTKQWVSFINSIQSSPDATLLSGIADNYAELGKEEQALDYYNQALKQLQSIGDHRQQINALKSIGKVLVNSGKIQQALKYYNQALTLLQKQGDQRTEAEILYLIGKAYSADKQDRQALDYYNQTLLLSQGLGDILKEADARLGIAIIERQRGNLAQARIHIETAVENIESERAQTSATEQKKENQNSSSPPQQTNYESYIQLATYLESKQIYYSFYIDLLMQLHKQFPSGGYNIQALQASERSHARSLLAIINKASRNPQGTQTANSSNSNYVELAKPPQIKEIQQQVLDDNTLLLEYALGEEHSYLWVVTKTTITSYELPKRAEIETAARLFYDFLTVPSQRIRTTKAAKAGANLSQMLLGPLAKQLGNKRLLVVADGVLQYIPFSALPTPNSEVVGAENTSTSVKPLLVNHEIINLPSASTLAVIRHSNQERRSPTKTLAVLADPVFGREDERITPKPSESSLQSKQNLSNLVSSNGVQSHSQLTVEQLYPRLPGTRKEADKILSFVPQSEQLQKYGFAASRQAVFSPELSQYRLIHFATHGILDTQKPERSGILLSIVNEQNELQRGLLSTPDTFNLNLSADLVVLSGCRTGLGKQIKGEGLIGLTGGLMYSGAKRVMVSLWSVDDEATVELMTRFYQRVLKDKLPPAKALREAQLTMWRDKRWQNPYDWAAFTIQGEWN